MSIIVSILCISFFLLPASVADSSSSSRREFGPDFRYTDIETTVKQNQGELQYETRWKSSGSDPVKSASDYMIRDIAIMENGVAGPYVIELGRGVEYKNNNESGSWHLK